MSKPMPVASGPAIEVRQARPEDAGTISHMVRLIAESQGAGARVTATATDFLNAAFGENRTLEAVIAERGGVPVGLGLFQSLFSTWDGKTVLHITDLFVDEAIRGSGIGFRLVQAIARIAKLRGCASLQLNVVHTNRNAAFFDQLGFSHQDDLLSYRMDGDRLAQLIEIGR